MSLSREFTHPQMLLSNTIGLLEESGDTFWCAFLKRALVQVQENRLSGATMVLGCYNGQDSFSDLVIGEHIRQTDELAYANLNQRLQHLRNEVFQSASAIASRRLW